MVISDS